MAETSTSLAPMVALRNQIESRSEQYAMALPSTMSVDKFKRVLLTSVALNPQLLECHRGSFLLAAQRCAQDGLLPDGREAAMVVFRDKNKGKIVQYLAMVAGIRKLVLQTGEVSVFDQHCVYENDEFDITFGSEPHIEHRPHLKGDRGPMIGVYSVARMRAGGLSMEWMPVEDVDKVRDVSRAKDAGPWKTWYAEMAKKTVAKRHAKMLPWSSERPIPRDDDEPAEVKALSTEARLSMHEQLDRLAAGPVEEDEVDYVEIPSEEDIESGRAPKPRPGEPGWSTATDAPPMAEG